jgi:arylsulfatase A-like enzyme
MYDAEVANQDVHVGAFIDKLRSSGRLEHTLLIICADHGDHLGEKQMMGHGFSLYNELVHVPLIIRDPDGNFPRGTVVERFVSTRRLFNTVLTTAGIAAEPEQTLTLAQSALGDPDAGTVFAEALPPQNALRMIRRRQPHLIRARDCDQVRRAICSDQHKLIQTGEYRLELYSMVEDPGEMLNLEAILPERVEALQEQLQRFVAQAPTTPPPDTRTASHDDPEVQRRLRDLGYLE